MKKERNFKSKLKGLISNIQNNTFLAWNDPYQNIYEWFWSRENIGRTYCRLVVNREKLMYCSWANTPQQGWKLLDSALRGGGIIWRNRYFQFRDLPKDVREALRVEWHRNWRVEIG
jgi:hypothetical protein|tara:strand:+ start:274 stop:621 length:348 start_codon:yes stop_codon:yes gene_type:complete